MTESKIAEPVEAPLEAEVEAPEIEPVALTIPPPPENGKPS